jgi:hypothetical protein
MRSASSATVLVTWSRMKAGRSSTELTLREASSLARARTLSGNDFQKAAWRP